MSGWKYLTILEILGNILDFRYQKETSFLQRKLVLVITYLGGLFWDKLSECIFENFEIVRVKRGQFQNYQKSPEPNM